jgi:hypothetical protein
MVIGSQNPNRFSEIAKNANNTYIAQIRLIDNSSGCPSVEGEPVDTSTESTQENQSKIPVGRPTLIDDLADQVDCNEVGGGVYYNHMSCEEKYRQSLSPVPQDDDIINDS